MQYTDENLKVNGMSHQKAANHHKNFELRQLNVKDLIGFSSNITSQYAIGFCKPLAAM